jgi:hypothetical protein
MLKWFTIGSDPGILSPVHWAERRSFLRVVWGSPWIRPLSYPFGPNPWSEWRWATLRLPWFVFPFLSVRIGKLMFYIGAKTYVLETALGHTYARPHELHQLTATFSARWGWEPLS